MKNRIRIGILVDNDQNIDFFSYDIIKWLNDNQKKFFICLLKQNLETKNSHQNFLKLFLRLKINNILNRIFYKLLILIEENLILSKFYKDIYKKKFDIKKFNLKTIELTPKRSKKKFILDFEKDSIEKIKKLKFDFLLRFGSKILVGKVLKITKNGIVSFHHGDNNYFRGGPAGFWEVFYKKNKKTNKKILSEFITLIA